MIYLPRNLRLESYVHVRLRDLYMGLAREVTWLESKDVSFCPSPRLCMLLVKYPLMEQSVRVINTRDPNKYHYTCRKCMQPWGLRETVDEDLFAAYTDDQGCFIYESLPFDVQLLKCRHCSREVLQARVFWG